MSCWWLQKKRRNQPHERADCPSQKYFLLRQHLYQIGEKICPDETCRQLVPFIMFINVSSYFNRHDLSASWVVFSLDAFNYYRKDGNRYQKIAIETHRFLENHCSRHWSHEERDINNIITLIKQTKPFSSTPRDRLHPRKAFDTLCIRFWRARERERESQSHRNKRRYLSTGSINK